MPRDAIANDCWYVAVCIFFVYITSTFYSTTREQNFANCRAIFSRWIPRKVADSNGGIGWFPHLLALRIFFRKSPFSARNSHSSLFAFTIHNNWSDTLSPPFQNCWIRLCLRVFVAWVRLWFLVGKKTKILVPDPIIRLPHNIGRFNAMAEGFRSRYSFEFICNRQQRSKKVCSSWKT